MHDCLASHGWIPCHLAVYADDNLAGAVPLYQRSNSHGEFVFDWAWAEAYERAGGRYYPKLVSAIPYAPVTGPRLLVRHGTDPVVAKEIRNLLIKEALGLVNASGMSSLHCLFTDQPDQEIMLQAGLLPRLTPQFHWLNNGYRDFEDFLDTLTSKKRKQIKRERRLVQEHGMEIEILTGAAISPEQWQVYHAFYCSTFQRRWGRPRLTLGFFESLSHSLPDRTLLILARQGNTYTAGAFAMLGKDAVYGRHWGCLEQFPFLHFELCYYQTIEYCIRHGLGRVDAGVQGEHKLARGFRPVATVSCHWIQHPGFRSAVADYLHRESDEIQGYLQDLRQHLPYKML